MDSIANAYDSMDEETEDVSNPLLVETGCTSDAAAPVSSLASRTCKMCTACLGIYKCPACGMFTCSLKCCVEHKAKFECSGKRDRAEFVSMSLYNVNTLRNDFHFLEDAQQSKQRAKRVLDSQNTLLTDCRGQNAEAYFRANNVEEEEGRRGGKRARRTNNNLDFLLLNSAGDGDGESGDSRALDVDSAAMELSSSEQPIVSVLALRREAAPVLQVLDNYAQHVRQFVLAARARSTNVILLSPGMFKRNVNSSRVVGAPGQGHGKKSRRGQGGGAAAVTGVGAGGQGSKPVPPAAEPTDTIYWRVHLVFLLTSSDPPATPAQGHGGPPSPAGAAGGSPGDRSGFLADEMLKLSLHGGNSNEVRTFTNPAPGQGAMTSHIQLETHCVGVALDNVHEDATVQSLVAGVLGNKEAQYYAVRNHLRFLRHAGPQGGDAPQPRCLIQELPQAPGGRKVFRAVDLQCSVRAALQGRTVIEYPTLFVSTREYLAGFHCLIQEE